MHRKHIFLLSVIIISAAIAAIGFMLHYHTGSPAELYLYVRGSSWSVDSTSAMTFERFLQTSEIDSLRQRARFLPVMELQLHLTNRTSTPLFLDSVNISNIQNGVRIDGGPWNVALLGPLVVDTLNRKVLPHATGTIILQWHLRELKDAQSGWQVLKDAYLGRNIGIVVHTNRGRIQATTVRYWEQSDRGILMPL